MLRRRRTSVLASSRFRISSPVMRGRSSLSPQTRALLSDIDGTLASLTLRMGTRGRRRNSTLVVGAALRRRGRAGRLVARGGQSDRRTRHHVPLPPFGALEPALVNTWIPYE